MDVPADRLPGSAAAAPAPAIVLAAGALPPSSVTAAARTALASGTEESKAPASLSGFQVVRVLVGVPLIVASIATAFFIGFVPGLLQASAGFCILRGTSNSVRDIVFDVEDPKKIALISLI